MISLPFALPFFCFWEFVLIANGHGLHCITFHSFIEGSYILSSHSLALFFPQQPSTSAGGGAFTVNIMEDILTLDPSQLVFAEQHQGHNNGQQLHQQQLQQQQLQQQQLQQQQLQQQQVHQPEPVYVISPASHGEVEDDDEGCLLNQQLPSDGEQQPVPKSELRSNGSTGVAPSSEEFAGDFNFGLAIDDAVKSKEPQVRRS